MLRLQRPCFLICRVARRCLSIALFLILGLVWLHLVVLAADKGRQQIDPQLQRPPDIPLERLERPLRTPPTPIKSVNLNRASIEQLVTLPGMNATLAQQIIEGRPYPNEKDLAQKHILPDATYNRIKDLITIE